MAGVVTDGMVVDTYRPYDDVGLITAAAVWDVIDYGSKTPLMWDGELGVVASGADPGPD